MYKEKIKLSSVDVDSNLNLRMPSIFKFFQQVSSNHSEILGVGKNNTIDKNMGWIILRFKVVVYDYPKLNDEIIVSTHPGETRKFLFPRHYQIYDKKGKLLVSACAIWLVINAETRRVVVKPFGDSAFKAEHSKDDIPVPEAFLVDDELNKVEDRLVRYSDTDLNGHLNNTKYIDYVLDTNEPGFLDENAVKRILVNYDKELKEGEYVELFANKDRNIVQGKRGNDTCFVAQIEYRKR